MRLLRIFTRSEERDSTAREPRNTAAAAAAAAAAVAAAAAAAAAATAEPAGTPTAARQALGAPAAETSRVLVVVSPCRSNNIVVNYIDSTLMVFVHLY